MKIGVLTFQYSINFGAQLQCLALQEVLKSMGHEVEVIRYTPANYNNSPFRGIGLKRNGAIKALSILAVKLTYGQQIKKRFRKFGQQYFQKTVSCDENSIASVVNNAFDAIIVGSDQVWGPSFHSTGIYFFNWEPEFKGKRISYAPCCAINRVADVNKKKLGNLLLKFDSLSVRNMETSQFVADLTGITPTMVLDPTFLYDFIAFKNSFEAPYKKYIFVYILGEEIPGGHEAIITAIKKERGDLPVIAAVLSERRVKFFSWADKTYWTLTPDKWVALIAYADYFYTDSFHGVVFAQKFGIEFLAYYTNEKRKSRFIDLASRFDLASNIVESVDDAIVRKCIRNTNRDYMNTNQFISDEIKKSKQFLIQSLNN